MLNLPTPITTLQVVTGAPVNTIAVHASFNDLTVAGTPVNPNWQNTAITLAATTTVVAAPAAGFDRNVKFLSVNNASLLPCAVTVQLFDGGVTPFVLFGPVTLLPAWSLHYNTDGHGFVLYDAAGKIQEA